MRARWPVAAALLLAASCAASPSPPLPAGAVPVVLVHGYGAEPSVFDGVRDHLEGVGYPPCFLDDRRLFAPIPRPVLSVKQGGRRQERRRRRQDCTRREAAHGCESFHPFVLLPQWTRHLGWRRSFGRIIRRQREQNVK